MSTNAPTTVTTPAELAATLGEVAAGSGRWRLRPASMDLPVSDEHDIVVAGRLASLVMVGDALVEVGGGVTLATVAQYLQSQTGIAPGWPVAADVTIADALSPATTPGSAAARIAMQMSKAVVEVEVARVSTRATEIWSMEDAVATDGTSKLPSDAVVAVVTVNMAGAAAAVRSAATGPFGAGDGARG